MKKLLLLGLFIQSLLSNNLPVKNQDVSPKQLTKQNKQIVQLVVQELSKDLPKTIDNYTKLSKIVGIDTNIIYIFEINTGAKSDITVQNEDRSRMEEAITYGVCRSSKRFLDAQIMITYKYISEKSKVELFKFDITQNKCFKNKI
jgi:hypothetical protein